MSAFPRAHRQRLWRAACRLSLIGWLSFSCACGTAPPDFDTVGGTVLVYQFKSAETDPAELILAMMKRVDPRGEHGINFAVKASDKIELSIPEGHDHDAVVTRVKKLLAINGVLRFNLVATERDNTHIVAQALKQRSTAVMLDDKTVGLWVTARPDQLESLEAVLRHPETKERLVGIGDLPIAELLVLVESDEEMNLTGEHLQAVSAGFDETVRPCLSFTLNETGSMLMERLTRTNLPDEHHVSFRHLAVILDGELVSAPRILSTIKDRGRITGQFTEEEVEMLVTVLRCGRLPLQLKTPPISERRVPGQ